MPHNRNLEQLVRDMEWHIERDQTTVSSTVYLCRECHELLTEDMTDLSGRGDPIVGQWQHPDGYMVELYMPGYDQPGSEFDGRCSNCTRLMKLAEYQFCIQLLIEA